MNQERLMDFTIKSEEAALTAVGIYFLYIHNLGLPAWAWAFLFLSPDLSMLGYLFNTRVGAFTYNMVHHRGLALALVAIGFLMQLYTVITLGLLLVTHSSFDRMLGYGLKYSDDFKRTSSGWIGKN
ncbi:MAG: DUF4260 family protein [Pedobacter sp.]|nr:MAG: DUF4260 family protein [Pedobacter sp.]